MFIYIVSTQIVFALRVYQAVVYSYNDRRLDCNFNVGNVRADVKV